MNGSRVQRKRSHRTSPEIHAVPCNVRNSRIANVDARAMGLDRMSVLQVGGEASTFRIRAVDRHVVQRDVL